MAKEKTTAALSNREQARLLRENLAKQEPNLKELDERVSALEAKNTKSADAETDTDDSEEVAENSAPAKKNAKK